MKSQKTKRSNSTSLTKKNSTFFSSVNSPNKPLMLSSKGGGGQATQALQTQLNHSKGSGSPLPVSTNQFMSNAFGNDFSKVRIHTGSRAIQMNQGLNARAFTHGKDVYFNKGEYRPDSAQGKKLLAHELTHVVQQKSGRKVISRAVKDEPCPVHTYDNSKPKDTAVIPETSLSQMIWGSDNVIGVGSVDDMVTKVNAYINNPDNKCKCVSRLEINGHGTDGYQSVGNGSDYVNDNKALVHDSKQSHLEKLKKIKFCSKGLLIMMGCHTGRGLGKTLLKKISNILPGILVGGAQHYTIGKGMGGGKVLGEGDKVDANDKAKEPEKAKSFLSSPYVNWHLTIGKKEYTITGADAKSASGQSKLQVADKIKVKTPEGEVIKIK